MKNLLRLLILLTVFSCSNTEQQINNVLTSEDFLRWKNDQVITFDLFKGKGPEHAYSMWVGFYFIYDNSSPINFKFNVTTFMDKNKSYVAETGPMTDTDKVVFFPTLYKLKFDHYEIYARQFRKHLIDNKYNFSGYSNDDLNAIMKPFYDNAEKSWQAIIADLEENNGYNGARLSQLRKDIDASLEELKSYGAEVNNYKLPN